MDFNTARLAHGDWTKDFSIDAADSRATQTRGLRLWPASFLNLTDAGCTRQGTFGGAGCSQQGGGGGVNFDNVGDQWKVLSRMPGKLSFDGYISQWSSDNALNIRGLVAAYVQVASLQEQPMTFPLPQGQGGSWDAVAFGRAASAPDVSPSYPASLGQALYVFRGTDTVTTKSFCLSTPINGTNSFTLVTGPDAGGASIVDAGDCPTSAGNYIVGGRLFTVSLPVNSGALWLRNVSGNPVVPAPSNVRVVQNDEAVKITWTNGSNAIAGSQISRSSDSGQTWKVIGTSPGTGTSYVDAGIAAGATYLYRVAAYDRSVVTKSAPATSVALVVQSAPKTTRIYDTDPQITYAGSTAKQHVLFPMPSPYGTAHDISDGGTATYTCRTACTRLVWNTRPGLATSNATATVTLTDGAGTAVDTRTVDNSGPAALTSRGVYDSGPLSADTYKLTVTADPGSTVEIDSIDVTALTPTLTDDDATPPFGDSLTYASAVRYPNQSPSSYVGGTAHSGTSPLTSFTYTCANCTELRWLSHTGPLLGSGIVTLDGVQQTTVSANAPTASTTSSVLYSTGTLPLGKHVLTISNGSPSKYLEADAFQVVRPEPGETGSTIVAAGATGWTAIGLPNPAPTVVDDGATPPAGDSLSYVGTTVFTNIAPSRGYIANTAHSGTSASTSFTYGCVSCTQIDWLSHTGPQFGSASITFDGVQKPSVSAYASTTSATSSAVYSTGTLASGPHTLTITNASSPSWLEADAFQIARPEGWTLYTPSNAPSITAANYYQQQFWATNTTVSDGTVKLVYTCSSDCDRLQLLAGTAPNLGIATVTVTDGGTMIRTASVDLYAHDRTPSMIVFDSGLLSAPLGKRYTITIKPTGTKNTNASGTSIEVHAMRVTRPPAVSAQYRNPDTTPPNVPPPKP
jgi:hypothetical protein